MGRKKKMPKAAEKVDVRLRMDADLAERLHEVARRYGTTLASFVRAAAIKEMERIEKEDKA